MQKSYVYSFNDINLIEQYNAIFHCILVYMGTFGLFLAVKEN